jgi:hypothetical protein
LLTEPAAGGEQCRSIQKVQSPDKRRNEPPLLPPDPCWTWAVPCPNPFAQERCRPLWRNSGRSRIRTCSLGFPMPACVSERSWFATCMGADACVSSLVIVPMVRYLAAPWAPQPRMGQHIHAAGSCSSFFFCRRKGAVERRKPRATIRPTTSNSAEISGRLES